MHFCKCTVHLAGERNFAVPKLHVSVAEIVVLRRLHGEDAVVDIQLLYDRARSLKDERDRLIGIYGLKPEYVKLVNEVFADAHVQGIETMADLGLVAGEALGMPKPAQPITLAASDLPVSTYDPAVDEKPDAIEDPAESEIEQVAVAEPEPEPEPGPVTKAAEPRLSRGAAAARAARRAAR